MEYYLSKYYSSKAIYFYFGTLLLVSVLFINRLIPIHWALMGSIEVIGFFAAANLLTRKWADVSAKRFEKNLFVYGLMLRVVWVIVSYIMYTQMTGKPFEFSAGDSYGYHSSAIWLKNMSFDKAWQTLVAISGGGVSDAGYAFYLTIMYKIFGTEVMIPRLIKAVLSAYMAVLVYRLAERNFGEDVGRIAGVFAMLMPNLIYYNGLHLKEVEMVFLTVFFLERADSLMRSGSVNIPKLILVIVLAAILFTFRTVLGVTALFSVLTALTLSTKRVSKAANRGFFIVWVVIAIAYFAGGRISSEIEEVWESRKTNQSTSYEARSVSRSGNVFARYASSSYLAPAIFVIPFPTMVNVETQQNQMLLHGGYFVKNVLAFFVFFSLFYLFRNKMLRDHLLILSFTVGYLAVIAFSAFAHSERFHQPVLPLLLILAAVGVVNMSPKFKRFYLLYLLLLGVVILVWSWYKLAGRGLA